MKNLFRDHSYNMVKMFLNQFATAIFGFSLALAAGKAQNPTLRNVTSIGAILFYLFLLFSNSSVGLLICLPSCLKYCVNPILLM